MAEPLITKYRPTEFNECVGNQEILKSLADNISTPECPHCFLFTGITGIGKTTIARIIAKHVNASINELDAATNSGVDDTKRIVDLCGFKPIMSITQKPNILYIIDECHALSKQAWSPLLKLIEEPPPFLYICFCTTDAQKVPATIKSRSYHVALKPLKPLEMQDLLGTIADLEGWKVNNDVFNAIVIAAEGSARLGINILQAGHACASTAELSKIIAEVTSDEDPAIKLAKYLLKEGSNWRQIATLLSEIDDEEAAVTGMGRYLAAAMIRSEQEQAQKIYRMLRAFTDAATFDKKIHLYKAIGEILWHQLPF